MLKKIKSLMNGYKREIEDNNIKLKRTETQKKIEKYIVSVNNLIDTNSIFY